MASIIEVRDQDHLRGCLLYTSYYYNMAQTDAAWIHKLFSGCPTLSACICARNVHTGNSMIDIRDYDCAKSALLAIITSLDENKINAYKAENR